MTRHPEGAESETTIERVGPYRVVRRLATGGTSDVLLAKAEGPHGFERHVVLKILLSEFGGDEEIKAMFVREASAYGRLSHPAIVRLFDFFAFPRTPGAVGIREGQLVMVLEHVDGPALSRLRSMLKAVGRELTDEVAIYIAMRIFSALAAAHGTTSEAGMPAPVIHRDVNPSNVLVGWDGEVKLADFGVAKVTGSTHQSVAGLIRGTYGYMAPEQVTGGVITPRADVYAAGIILWELLTKRRAFQRGALPESEALRAMAEPHLVSIDAVRPEVDRAVREGLKRALEPRAERRTVTAEEMAVLLTSVVPADLGKERLVAALATMRDDARARNAVEASPRPSTIPPPDAPPTPTGPRPGGTAKILAAGLPPRLPRSQPKLPAANPPPRPPPSRPAIRAASPQPKPGSTTLLLGSAAGRQAGPPEAKPPPKPTSESMIETPRAPDVTIAEILRSVPSSMPPSVIGPNASSGQTVITPRFGQIPAAPDAMTSPLAATVLAPPARPPEAPDVPSPNTPRMAPLARTMLLGPFVDTPPSEPDGLRFAPLAAPLGNPGPPPPPAPFGPPTPVTPTVAFGAPPPPEPRPMPPAAAPPPYAESAPAGPPLMFGGSGPPAPFAASGGPPAAAPRARSGVALYAALVVGAALVAVVLVIGFIRRQPKVETVPSAIAVPGTPAPPIPTPAPTPEPTPTVSVAPEPTPAASDAPVTTGTATATATATASAAGEGVGLLDTSGSSPGHRIFVDERVVAQTPQSVSVPCGKHTVRLGSAGKPQSVEVPCGGQVTVADK